MKKVLRSQIEVQLCSKRKAIPKEKLLKKWVKTVLTHEKKAGSVCVRVINEKESQVLNTKYRNQAKPTNVLSFSATGDLAVCAPVVGKEANLYQLPLLDHWAHVIVHGTLHLIGYDHQTKRDTILMEEKEAAILKHLGFSDPHTHPHAF